jgi:hypothetical protein
MISFKDASEWRGDYLDKKKGRIVIDFVHASSRSDAILAIGHVLKGGDSPTMQKGNLDALKDVVSDWVIENAAKRTEVFLINCYRIEKAEKGLLDKIADVMSHALTSGTRYVRQEHEELDVSIPGNNIRIYIFKSIR